MAHDVFRCELPATALIFSSSQYCSQRKRKAVPNQLTMDSGHENSKEGARTLQAILPLERCQLDGQSPHDSIRLACGHIYCKLCLQDLMITAMLVGQRSRCKTCFFEFGPPAGSILQGTLGERTKQVLTAARSPTVPGVSYSQRLTTLLDGFTASRGLMLQPVESKDIGVLDIQTVRVNPPQENRLQQVLFMSTQPDKSATSPFRDKQSDLLAGYGGLDTPANSVHWVTGLDSYADILSYDCGVSNTQFDNGTWSTHPDIIEESEKPTTLEETSKVACAKLKQQPGRDLSVLAGERFCFKGKLRDQISMENAVRENGGNVTGGGYKHTTYGVVGSGWKVTSSWKVNKVRVLSEEEFWELLESKKRESQAAREAAKLAIRNIEKHE
ncbi:uncharacterized protein PV09_01250 [Verruconis gallopava]|uniref:BRCT domain-containing protein n=1 Tax=Verruconis gallopava TaxID=253628 RepID=A0A0D2ANN5_9PEZI|nr:uncharacterized protein PV09_01250 [Verruconis gallopava]KIW08333.1 hypothetical protein PV09_01250 [Verruconis gallopava]